MAVETRDQLKVERAQISTLSADMERLIKANNTLMAEAQAIRKDFEDYKDEVKGQMDALYRRKSSENFETWFTNLLIWLDYNHFTDDKDKIQQANAHLEGGAALYMKEYAIKLTSEQDVGTWAEYTRKLEMAHKTLDPKCTAQSMLDVHCTIHHKMMIAFAENFRAYAPKSGYSDKDLIVKIREQRSTHIQTVILDTSSQIAALEQAIAALREMKTSTPMSSIGKGKEKVKKDDVASNASTASTAKDTNARIIEMDEFLEDFQYEV
ncbi:uncharacterized protein LAESUDRAFT_765146 [Laetiporus sulphureus 93-53]|uniref:Uncharacterized protein n=1 Tax=Laetiporus sulphureus 93-53 TaxID=1314785 RepID=A0A165AXR7_9APHY|nr:uncharacterized protein LAESUDRAFT_765146 [Laetiporus sulphureus 93-53]KZS99859.1 hypothetical protein LAESUDRAFT_765146 [Laetiporus sulphureus 93-53]